MTDIGLNAVHSLNRFIYDLLRSNGVIGDRTTDYGGRTPIIATQQEPSMLTYNKPFLVYAFTESAPDDLEMLITGTVAYAIYSADERDIIKIINVMREGLKHFDQTASDINHYKFLNNAFRDTLFTSVTIGMIEGPSPATTEGGRQSGVVMVRYTYSPNYNITIPTTMT